MGESFEVTHERSGREDKVIPEKVHSWHPPRLGQRAVSYDMD